MMMKTLRSLVVFTTAFAIATSTLNAQPVCCQEDCSCGSAYVESTRSAHWSVYVPIAVLVGAAIWFGLADRNDSKQDSSHSQDGLGSIANSKRISSSSTYRSYRSKTLPPGSYSH